MAFEGLTEKINSTFKKLRGKGRLKESDIKEAMREIRLALLEADVSYKVVKDFTKGVTERCMASDVLEALTPAQTIVKIVNEELTALMGSENQKLYMASQPPTIVMLFQVLRPLQIHSSLTSGVQVLTMTAEDGRLRNSWASG